MSFFNFQFWIEIEIHKNGLFHYNFKMKIEWHFRCTDSTSINNLSSNSSSISNSNSTYDNNSTSNINSTSNKLQSWKRRSYLSEKRMALMGFRKNLFLQCVCYWYNLLWWMFLILCDNWKTLLFIIVYHYPEIILTAMLLLSLKPVFWRKSAFYPLSPQ